MNVRKATLKDKASWDAFVEQENGSFFHYFDWKNIYEGNTWEYIPLVLENDTPEIIGIFPVVKIRSFLYSKLVSLPDGASGGFILKKQLSFDQRQHAAQLFLDYIIQYHSKRCSALVLKENLTLDDASKSTPTHLLVNNGFSFRFDDDLRLPCTYRLPLLPSFEDLWEGLWGKYLRNHIRKSEKQGILVREDTTGVYHEDVSAMIQSIYRNFHETPPSKNEIRLRLSTFKDKTKVWVALLDGAPIATLVCYYFNNVLCYASKLGYTSSAREYYTTVYLFSEAIKDACKNGYRYFEFGVTETETLAQWKEQFKPIKIPLRIYRKKYSTIRSFFEITPALFSWSLKNKSYIWRHRKRLIRKMIRFEF